jgi:uroporphyrinogen decarboxylase
VKPHTTEVFRQIAERHPGIGGIHFGIGCDHLLESMNSVGNVVMGLDWRTTISDARHRLGADTIVQGNLDPALVLAGRDIALRGARAVLADNNDHPGHIFNLGHGVQPDTDPDVLHAVVDFVHSGGHQ